MSETWERLKPTIERLRTTRNCTVAEAQLALIEACSQGEIRTIWLGYYDPPCPLISKMDWIGADIDLYNDRIVKADGKRMAYVGFSRDDLEGWLTLSAPAETPSALPQAEATRQVEKSSGDELALLTTAKGRAQWAIAEIRKDPSVDVDKMSSTVLTDKVCKLLKSRGVTVADLPSQSTVERADRRRP